MYEKYLKRAFDFCVSLLALIVLSPILLILIVIGTIAMYGNPFFVQPRPGKKDKLGNEKIFRLIKFRTMNNRKDEKGNLLSDDIRLTKYGRFLRKTSLDELPELLNILRGDMSIVGPRPQLVRDMVFMTENQRKRHDVRPGLSGLAQVRGRNNISWENKLSYDLEYIEHITFWCDIKLIFETIWKAFVKQEDIATNGMETAEDFGDYLLRIGEVSDEDYIQRQSEARELLGIGE